MAVMPVSYPFLPVRPQSSRSSDLPFAPAGSGKVHEILSQCGRGWACASRLLDRMRLARLAAAGKVHKVEEVEGPTRPRARGERRGKGYKGYGPTRLGAPARARETAALNAGRTRGAALLRACGASPLRQGKAGQAQGRPRRVDQLAFARDAGRPGGTKRGSKGGCRRGAAGARPARAQARFHSQPNVQAVHDKKEPPSAGTEGRIKRARASDP